MVSKKDLSVFGGIWAFIFFIIAIYPIFGGNEIRMWSLVISLLFVVIVLLKPMLLTSFYHIWVKFGEFIGGYVSKLILIILFYGMFTPISFVLKLLKKDLLKKKVDLNSDSYWIKRERQPESMKNQF